MTESAPCLTATPEAYDAVAVRYAALGRNALDRLPLDRAVLAAFAGFHRVFRRVLAPGGHLLRARQTVRMPCGAICGLILPENGQETC
ncbi:hypothetical protein [Microbispora sp. CA-102843]|uniref:hypothetical protein n=1 Tax=Microbispora sp. CA-102843 TaxID=3239952 RepID=UPI003D947ADD